MLYLQFHNLYVSITKEKTILYFYLIGILIINLSTTLRRFQITVNLYIILCQLSLFFED